MDNHPITFMHRLSDLLPMKDKILVPLGAVYSTASILTNIQTVIGILVGLLTIAMLVPRVCAAWRNPADKDSNNDDMG